MESISLGDIAAGVAFLVGLIGGIIAVRRNLKTMLTGLLQDELTSLKNDIASVKNDLSKDISSIRRELSDVDMEACKNYLVRFLADVEQGKAIDEIELQRFWEQYDHYEKRGGNSYIHQKVEKLRSKNYL